MVSKESVLQETDENERVQGHMDVEFFFNYWEFRGKNIRLHTLSLFTWACHMASLPAFVCSEAKTFILILWVASQVALKHVVFFLSIKQSYKGLPSRMKDSRGPIKDIM